MLGRTSGAAQPIETKQLARGKVTDRPWGLTVAAIGLAGDSGVLTLNTADKKVYRVVFSGGLVVDASSPVSVDSIARVALTSKLLPAAHAAEIGKRIARTPDADEAAIVAEVAKLTHDEIERLRWRAIRQRAARTFSIDTGMFKFERQGSPPIGAMVGLDVRAVVYAGAHLHLSDQRTFDDLRVLGSRFVMKDDAQQHLPRFELTAAESPIIESLARGTTLAEIDALHRDIDPRTARAVVYALACCDAITHVDKLPKKPNIAKSRTTTGSFSEEQLTAVSARSLSQREIQNMIADRCMLIDAGRDLFAVLALEVGASIEAVRSAYLELIRYVHPDKLAMFGIPGSPDSQRLYSRAGLAYATLTDPAQRARYLEEIAPAAAPLPPAPLPREDDDDAPARAHEHYLRASRLLEAERPRDAVGELERALGFAPANIDYRAMHAWATFCASADRQRVAVEVRKVLERAIYKSQQPEIARTYLGKVERMLGHDLEALYHFREVLVHDPNDEEVMAEIRVIEARIARGTKQLR